MSKLKYIAILLVMLLPVPGFIQTIPIKILTYNTSDKSGTWSARKPYLHNVISTVDPDIIVAVEINNDNTDDFLANVLDSSYSKGDFIANGSYSLNSNCLYYKTSEFESTSFDNTVIPSYLDLTQTTRYRDINKFTITQNGGETIIIYAIHLISNGSSGTSDMRSAEISYLLTYLHDNASSTDNYIVLGDFNIANADELAYQNLLYYPTGGLDGYFYDSKNNPPTTFGSWGQSFWSSSLSYSSTSQYARYDMILMSENVWNGSNGIVYHSGSYTVVGNPSPTSDEETTSDHLPVYATFDFADNATPVELSSFTGIINNGESKLKWRTATEINNYGFEIQRSSDGIYWTNIGFIPGNGNSNAPKNYSFTDKFIPVGKVFYRLKQEDNNGKFEYSDIVELNNEYSFELKLSQNFPNPFNPVTTIKFQIPVKSKATLKIIDMLGREIKTLVDGEVAAGEHKIFFDGSFLSSGIYICQLIANGKLYTKKMMLLKASLQVTPFI